MTSIKAMEPVAPAVETPQPLLFDRQRAAIHDLLQLIKERRRNEEEVLPRLDAEEREAIEENAQALERGWLQREHELASLEANLRNSQREQTVMLESELSAEAETYNEALRVLALEEKNAGEKMQTSLQDALWAADSFLEAALKRIDQQRERMKRSLEEARERGDRLWAEFLPKLARAGLGLDALTAMKNPPALAGDKVLDLTAHLDRAEATFHYARDLRVRNWLRLPVQLGLIVLSIGLPCLPALILEPWLLWLAAGLPVGIALALVQRIVLASTLRRQVRSAGRGLKTLLAQARDLGDTLLTRSEEKARNRQAEAREQHSSNREKALGRYRPLLIQLAERIRSERVVLMENHQARQEGMRLQQRLNGERLLQRHEDVTAECRAKHDRALELARKRHQARIERIKRERAEAIQSSTIRWDEGCRRFLDELEALKRAATERGMVGSNAGSTRWEGALSTGLPLGTMTLDLQPLFEDVSAEHLEPLPMQSMRMPAFLPLPRCGGLLLEAYGAGRQIAIESLQALMVRFLTALPPGKVRFTIIDPVGLGDNFSAFMHLAEHNESLVTSRIWTEANHVDSQLADLTEHLENVIQKYLRSQFSSIEDYNRVAGEVAEPYRVLIVANFPVNFSPQAARRLVSIVQSGASCGVYALISADVRQPMPQGLALEELEELCLMLRWEGKRFVWDDPDLDQFALALEKPPENGQLIKLMRNIGLSSRGANRVEVPLSYVLPAEEEIWKGDSRRGISVPLGRAGAVRKQSLRLGEGTAQHVLVAGKTGSGKSTLWHALIVNLALHYSPDEVELFLIDFKKGVEFKPYAEHQLPHARVVAIESEREFGLSVLQWLDSELRSRGDRFRTAGVNDVASYRQAHPDKPCPRILLIVDEFQEFFVEDDRLSLEASLLLDRLVRQGRAFGLHVLLGSQTLGGAYSLARSTIDQMVVRIALQCSETDAQLILNKDNSAARLLSRPGEAIYNDASGALEGNEIFQIVWLSEEERFQHLKALHERMRTAPGLRSHTPPIVFESTIPARLDQNPLLLLALRGDRRPACQLPEADEKGRGLPTLPQLQPCAWLGEAIAIKDPTAAIFRPQSGSNLLVIGQHEESATAMLAAAIVSLAVQHPPGSARFWLCDGTGQHEPMAGYLPAVLDGWPHALQNVEMRDVAQMLASLAEELGRRLKGEGGRERYYLLIHGLQRFRDIRRTDDEFGFGRRGAERTVPPGEHFQALLRDGPAVGMHLLLWCDQLSNLNRAVDRQGLRDCGLRVLFQMSAADSSHLLDSPLASRLGRNRALFSQDEMPQPEKFRPYELPSLSWLREIKAQLSAK